MLFITVKQSETKNCADPVFADDANGSKWDYLTRLYNPAPGV